MTTQVQSRANLSRFHPDYGLSPQEHEIKKARRAAGKERFIDKEAARQKFYGKRRK